MSCGVDQLEENYASETETESRKVSSRSRGQERLKSCCFLGTEFQFKLVKTILDYYVPEL